MAREPAPAPAPRAQAMVGAVLKRRDLLVVAAGAGAALATGGARAREADAATLRIFRVRGRTLLVDLGGRRVLVDPCFAEDLGASVLYDAPPASIAPEDTGDVDVLLVTAREPGAFDGASTARLRGRRASCFVPDEQTAKILRYQGFRRVRVVRAGDVFETRDVVVSMSPSGSLLGADAVGFHLSRGGRTLWHAGAPPPLDVAAGAAQFARDHGAEVVAACALGLSFAGAPRTLDREDALLLAGLSHARYAVLLGDDIGLSALGGLVVKAEPGWRRVPQGVRVRPIVVEEGRWYRILPG